MFISSFIDYSESNGVPWVRGTMKPKEDARFSQTANKQWKLTKPKRLSSRKATVINFFQSRMKKKPKSGQKLKFRDRIVAFMNNDTMKNFRNIFRFIWSPKKTTGKALAELKGNVLKLSTI